MEAPRGKGIGSDVPSISGEVSPPQPTRGSGAASVSGVRDFGFWCI